MLEGSLTFNRWDGRQLVSENRSCNYDKIGLNIFAIKVVLLIEGSFMSKKIPVWLGKVEQKTGRMSTQTECIITTQGSSN
jgi:hypothetical protein